MRLRATRATSLRGGAPSYAAAHDPILSLLATNPGVYYRADAIGSMTQDGAVPVTAAGQPVGAWSSLAGGERVAVQTSATARPIYRIGVDGIPYLEFAVDDQLLAPSAGLVTGGLPSRIWVVSTHKNTAAAAMTYSRGGGTRGSRGIYSSAGGAASLVSATVSSVMVAGNTAMRHLISGSFWAGGISGRYNAGSVSSISATLNTTSSGVRIGQLGASSDIYAVVEVCASLSDDTANEITSYLASKFGVQL